MNIRKYLSVIIALTVLTSTTAVTQAATNNKNQTVYAASASFAKEYNLESEDISTPIIYDLNNDGKDEIILSTAKKEISETDLYIGIYSLTNGKKVTAMHEPNSSGVPYEVRRIKNKTYKNCIALVSFGATGFGAYEAEILTLKNNKLTRISVVSADGGGEGNIIVDLSKDGYHEFAAIEVESGIGSDRLGFSGAANNITFRWDETKKKYIQYGPDGVRDDQRKAVGTLTANQALDILTKAYKVQKSFVKPLPLSKVEAAMKPYFSNNFISEFQGSMFEYSSGYVPDYMDSDDYSALLPKYNVKQKLTLKFNANKTSVVASQKVTVQGEESTYSVIATTTLVKTKYGWKIDKF
ncbi:hypothetical protein PAECIP111893_03822 [Paenibacillus plantiphilus]|uniref:VCBS repeat-containing protein n=1 Tax=Paenibacillus plantiphilus TaxID=2905650 RepID=A0ABM9CHR7_9BACL|nr:hypothetical protein [Paenibacillus plantiphilus]CAH1214604.1 hypothetical protein PAECIP111893_03822 [Paenibacillus plantiphilus]